MAASPGHGPRASDGGVNMRMLSALRYPQYRRYWIGNLGAVSGQQMMWVAQGVLVYQLTGSPVYLGYVGLVTALPAILLNLVGGIVADRFDQRRIIISTQLVTTASVLALGTLTALDVVHVWHVLVVAFISGSMQAFNNPARQAIFPQLLDRKDLMNAVALNSIIWQGTRIVAPATGGLLLAFTGAATTFFVCAIGFLVLGLAVASLKVEHRVREGNATMFEDLGVGLSFVRANFLFAFLIGMSFFNSFFGFSTQQMMPVFAEDILNVGEAGLGFLLSTSGVGSILGIMALGYAGNTDRKGILIIGGAALFGSFIILFAFSTYYPLSLLAVFLMGASGSIYMITVQTTLQMRVPDELRGRVMGIYGVTHNIGPLGAMQAGLLASAFGAPTALAVGGLAIILFALAVASSNREVRALQTPAPAAA